MPKTKDFTLDFMIEPAERNRLANLCGPEDENLKYLEKYLRVTIAYTDAHFQVSGDPRQVQTAASIIRQLYLETVPVGRQKKAPWITLERVHLALLESRALLQDESAEQMYSQTYVPDTNAAAAVENEARAAAELSALWKDRQQEGSAARPEAGADAVHHEINRLYSKAATLKLKHGMIKPRTANQNTYIANISTHDVNFGIGPAGTGKTYLAVAAAVSALESNEVRRIILTRPAVEAGEKLGFLPGDLSQKVDPYLRPLYDALFEMLGFEKVEKLIERQVIEIAPLAYMRGRTLNDSFIILDEAQNTTIEQMKMFLTRIGFNSRAVITGDPSQIDLPRNVRSGLRHAIEVLRGIDSLSFTFFETVDVVRHPVVAAIVNAYAAYDQKQEALKAQNAAAARARMQQTAAAEAAQGLTKETSDGSDH